MPQQTIESLTRERVELSELQDVALLFDSVTRGITAQADRLATHVTRECGRQPAPPTDSASVAAPLPTPRVVLSFLFGPGPTRSQDEMARRLVPSTADAVRFPLQ